MKGVTPSEPNFWRRHKAKIAAALILTFVSAMVDISGFLGIYHFFTAHLTGTAAQLGSSVVRGNWKDLIPALSILGAFFVGSVLGRIVIEIGARKRWSRIASITLAVEALLLAGVGQIATQILGGTPTALANRTNPAWGLAVLAAAMGLQTATLTRVGPLSVHTTFVTGMVNKLSELVSHIAFRGYDLRHAPRDSESLRRSQGEDLQQSLFLFGIWVIYVIGAAFGTVWYRAWGLRVLFAAAGFLLLAIVIDQFWPFSLQEERHQLQQ